MSPDDAPVTILLVDDHPTSRTPLALLLNHQPGLQVVAEAGSVAEAKASIGAGLCPDIAIVDLDLGDGRGVDVIQALRTACAGTRILVLTALQDDRARGEALYEGAAGAMLKSASTDDLIDAVWALSTGHGSPMAPEEAIRLMRIWIDGLKDGWRFEQALATLTPREHEVLLALTDGLTDEEVAARHGISLATTRSHVRAVLGKLGVESRLKAVVLAYRAGHVVPPSQPGDPAAGPLGVLA